MRERERERELFSLLFLSLLLARLDKAKSPNFKSLPNANNACLTTWN